MEEKYYFFAIRDARYLSHGMSNKTPPALLFTEWRAVIGYCVRYLSPGMSWPEHKGSDPLFNVSLRFFSKQNL